MNKYLLLIRLFLRHILTLCFTSAYKSASHDHKHDGNEAQGPRFVDEQIKILAEWPLSPRERKVPDGLRLHVLDIWEEEISTAREEVVKRLDEEGQVEDDRSEKQDHQTNGDDSAEEQEGEEQGQVKKRKRSNPDQPQIDNKRQKKAGKSRNINPDDLDHAIAEVLLKLTQPVRILAKDGLAKGVRMKAKAIVQRYDEAEQLKE
jgi:hypothetical protein